MNHPTTPLHRKIRREKKKKRRETHDVNGHALKPRSKRGIQTRHIAHEFYHAVTISSQMTQSLMQYPNSSISMWRLFLVFSLFSISDAGIVVRPRHCGGAVRHVHLAVGPDPSTSMTVSFASIPSHYTKAPIAGVAIGKSPTDYHVIVVTDEPPSSYNVTIAAAGQANGPPDDDGNPKYWSPYYHHVTITGLEPDTTYYYQPLIAGSRKDLKHSRPNLRHSTGAYTPTEAQTAVEMVVEEYAEYENDDDVVSQDSQRRRLAPPPYDGYDNECPAPDKIRHFKTASQDPSQTTRLAIVGDLGQFPHSQVTLQRLYRSPEEFDAVLLAGDIAYAQTDGRKWDTFFDLWDDTALAERVPVSGNEENVW